MKAIEVEICKKNKGILWTGFAGASQELRYINGEPYIMFIINFGKIKRKIKAKEGDVYIISGPKAFKKNR